MKKRLAIFAVLPLCLLILSGCGSQRPDVSLKAAVSYAYSQVLDPYAEEWLSAFEEGKAAEKLGVGTSLYTEAAMYASSRDSRCTILAGFRAAEGEADALQDALQTAKENAVISFNGYLPDQYSIAQNAEIWQHNDSYFLIMTEDNERVIQVLESFLNGEENTVS